MSNNYFRIKFKHKEDQIMNPEIAKYWNKALEAFNTAKTNFENGEPDSEVKKVLWMAVSHGQFITRHLNIGGEESTIAAGTAIENLSQLERLDIRQAFDKVLKALKEYHNLIPDEYNLPLPTGIGNR